MLYEMKYRKISFKKKKSTTFEEINETGAVVER